MKIGILLRSIRLTRVTCICAVSEEVFSQARLAQTGVTAIYYPAAGAVVFERKGHEPHIVLNHLIVDMVADEKSDWDRWLSPMGWDYPEVPGPVFDEGREALPIKNTRARAKAAKKARPKARVR